MKKEFILLIVGILLLGSCVNAQSDVKNKKLQEFVTDLSSANVKLRGKLLLFGQYKNDLSSLTYSRYIELLKENESSSNEGIADFIQKADRHVFATKRNSFCIAIFSKELKAVIYDDANTSFLDFVKTITQNEEPTNLSDLIKGSEFKIVYSN